jgi:hypothetical protein
MLIEVKKYKVEDYNDSSLLFGINLNRETNKSNYLLVLL